MVFNYYPFGLRHKGYNNVVSANANGTASKYKTYQGQQWHDELGLNLHEWKYRFSDPATGRFISIDPLAEEYAYNSTYAFQENKLGMGIELEGAELLQWAKDSWKGLKRVFVEPVQNAKPHLLDNTPTASTPTKNITGNYFGDALYKLAGGETISKAIAGDDRAQGQVIMNGIVALSPAGKGIGDDVVKNTADDIVDLGARAKQIHSALPEATQRRTTTAVAEVTGLDGNTSFLVGSSEKRLRPAQRAVLNANETAVTGNGHAEVTVINYAIDNRQTVNRVGASRPICNGCASRIRSVGATPASPLKNVPKPVPPLVDRE